MEAKTAGTHLFLFDPDAAEPVVTKFRCPTGISGVTSGTRTRIPTTCLDEEDEQSYTSGLLDPGAAAVPFILHTDDNSHQQSFELKKGARKLKWMVGLSDGKGTPTVEDGKFVPPTGATARTTIAFDAYIADLDLDMATNEVVRGTMSLQRSGTPEIKWKTPAQNGVVNG